ncbi:MAG: hypothetical protein AAF530_17555 [Pseudomonadota bacterium]
MFLGATPRCRLFAVMVLLCSSSMSWATLPEVHRAVWSHGQQGSDLTIYVTDLASAPAWFIGNCPADLLSGKEPEKKGQGEESRIKIWISTSPFGDVPWVRLVDDRTVAEKVFCMN